jgi:hypothetical protein
VGKEYPALRFLHRDEIRIPKRPTLGALNRLAAHDEPAGGAQIQLDDVRSESKKSGGWAAHRHGAGVFAPDEHIAESDVPKIE